MTWNGLASSESVPAMLDVAAREWPHDVAVTSDSGDLTWQQLAGQAARTARELATAGARAGDVVAVSARRGPEFLVGILAAWRAGCAFTVVDQSLPEHRRRAMMTTCRSAVLCDGLSVEALPFAGGPVRTDDAAYVLFTSGSSGQPKGAVVGHRALANTIRHLAQLLAGAHGRPRGICLTPLSFDAALAEIFATLAAGGRVTMASPALRTDPDYVSKKIIDGEVNWLAATPSWLTVFAVSAEDALRGVTILSGGEPLKEGLAHKLIASGADVWNCYGPTETAICATMHQVRPSDSHPIPVGPPMPGMTISIVDEGLDPLPSGAIGEIVIGGVGVGLGYINDPERTRAAFIAMPGGGTGYRTGDLGSVDASGALTCYGRLDDQVKVHGNRIELGDIEVNARACAGVADAVAVVADASGRKRLGLLVSGTASDSAVRDFLASRLPAHMRPAVIVTRPAMPMTDRGKLDRQRAVEIVNEMLS